MGDVAYLVLCMAVVGLSYVVGFYSGKRHGYDQGCEDTYRYVEDCRLDDDAFESYMKGN